MISIFAQLVILLAIIDKINTLPILTMKTVSQSLSNDRLLQEEKHSLLKTKSSLVIFSKKKYQKDFIT